MVVILEKHKWRTTRTGICHGMRMSHILALQTDKYLSYKNLRQRMGLSSEANQGWLSWLHWSNSILIPDQAWTNKQGHTECHTAASTSSGKDIQLDLRASQCTSSPHWHYLGAETAVAKVLLTIGSQQNHSTFLVRGWQGWTGAEYCVYLPSIFTHISRVSEANSSFHKKFYVAW